ncbi:MAG: dihydrofolate reductase family protein [Chitinophagales bacterium]|nr:dihydrofolate reductase family protein [Chitinophagales bacterium]
MQDKKNSVFIATSIDGFIADKNGGIEWLNMIPNPEHIDAGYAAFTKRIDALVMGRVTFETVCGFDIDWPYNKPVYVLSNSLKEVPENYQDKVELVNGSLTDVLDHIHTNGHFRLYIDGGTTIQNFLKEDLIDEIVLTTIPILLGEGYPLFASLSKALKFELVETKVFLNQLVQRHYIRIR